MSPMPNKWNTDITLGFTDELLPMSYEKRTEEMMLHEIPRENGGSYNLKWPLKIQLDSDDDLFYASNDDLDILSYGESEKECMSNFYSMFEELKEYYCKKDVSELSNFAIRLKALFSTIAD